MLVKVILLVELLSVFLCVFRVYGQKPKIDVKGVISFLIMFIILDVVNYWGLPRFYILGAYIVLGIYSISMFKDKFVKTVISVVLSIIIIAVVQFAVMILLSVYPFENYNIRDVLGSAMTFLVIWRVLPYCKINKLRDGICRKHWLMYIIFAFIVFTVMFAVIIGKITNELQMGLFIFGIPAIAIIIFLVIYWDLSVDKANKMEKEIAVLNSIQNNYEELLECVRINQHGLKNHISAVYSTHHMCKTYEQLIAAQEAYCEELYEENKFNNILLVQNNILAGFLYKKVLEIEKENIKYTYKIESHIEKCSVSDFCLVEMLGVLIDNAIDASKENELDGEIYLSVSKESGRYKFTVQNTYKEVTYKEMEKWFKLGKTSKVDGHGIGLYRVKQMCREHKCDLKCYNKQINEKNWIIFELFIDEKEDVA